MSKNKFYVTTPIYYVNAQPHLGTLYTTVIADVAARWNKIRGKSVYFLTGTDEHGQKIAERAALENQAPKDFVDSIVPHFKSMWQYYGIEYSSFIRTTDDAHKRAVTHLIQQLIERDEIYKSAYIGLYCTPDETFVTHEQAVKQGDQMLCPSCMRELKEVSEESYFFRLSSYGDKLLEFYEKNPNFIHPKERLNEVIEFVKSGLKDLSFSRKTVSWGIPFPGDPSHTVYVWGDALTNYISAVGYGDPARIHEFESWWPADLQIMGKDILRFHAVYWPAMLMALDQALPKKLLVHSYILMNDVKMSKSRGNILSPTALAETFGQESIRYYLMRYASFAQDASVSLGQMEQLINADLANNLGNLVNRTLSLARANGLHQVHPVEIWEEKSVVLKEKCYEMVIAFCDEMAHYNYHVALGILWRFVAEVNAFMHATEPWKVVKTNPELFAEIISAVCHSLHAIALVAWPVMPKKMETLVALLGVQISPEHGADLVEEIRTKHWTRIFTLSSASTEPLFPRIESAVPASENKTMTSAPADAQQKAVVTIDDFAKLDLAVGTITACEPLSGSNKLLKLTVDFGERGMRQILSGIAQYTTPEKLVGVQALFVVNFPERSMMGHVSQGMLLSVHDAEGKFSPATVNTTVKNGSSVK